MAVGRLLVVPSVAAAVVLGACGGSAAQVPTGPSQAVPAKAPQVLMARHNLRTFRLTQGRSIELRLAHGAELASTGRAVSLTPIDFFVDPGYVAWELSGVARGRAVLKGRAGGKPFRVTLVVPG
jgi:hypothetical protein